MRVKFLPRSFSALVYIAFERHSRTNNIALRYTLRDTRFRTQYAIGVLRGGANHQALSSNEAVPEGVDHCTFPENGGRRSFGFDLASGLIKPAEPLPSRCGLPG
jgi:hypothetical protein